jgi:O-antigen ligase
MSTSVVPETAISDRFGYRLVFFLWFLFLFEPARLTVHYMPMLRPLIWLPTLLLMVAIIHWLGSPLRKYNYKWFMIFLFINLLGTVVAFWDGNWGIARQINRQIFQFFMLGVLTFTYFDNYDRVQKLFSLYFLHFIYFAAWGIFSLHFVPIDPSVDPGLRVIIPWHHWLDNRDAFGPLMVIAIAYSYYYYQGVENRKLKMLSLVCMVLCVCGVVLSFGRGVFLAMVAALLFMWIQSKRKLAGILLLLVMVGLLVVAESIISPGDMYWETMRTIEEGTSEGTGADRKFLWGLALKEFIDNPIFGVGTGNFGIAVLKVIAPDEALKFGYTQGRLWGRALHCAPLTILSEYGLVGSVVFIFLIIDFMKTNRMSERISFALLTKEKQIKLHEIAHSPARTFYFISMGMMACFVAFWVNGFFYEIIYTPFFWNLIVLNKLINIYLLNGKFQF